MSEIELKDDGSLSRARKRSFLDKKKIMILILFGLFSLSAAGIYYLLPSSVTAILQGQDPEIAKRLNILLMAIDARPGENTGRTDSLILASIDREKKQIYLLSIPRDTRVTIPGHGVDKINAAHVYGGPELTQQVVEDLTGIQLNYYIKTDFNGFKKIIDTLGGVTIDVEKNLYYPSIPGESIDLKKGVQLLDGDKALQYVRFRNEELGDISRTQRQQKFLKALAKETFSPGNILKLPTVIPQWFDVVETNLPMKDMLSIATIAKDMGSAELFSMTLPGQFLDLNGISYWQVDPEHAKENARNLLLGEVVTEFIDKNTVVPVQRSKSQPAAPNPESVTVDKKVYSTTDSDPQNPTNPSGDSPNGSSGGESSTTPPTDPEAGGIKEPTNPEQDVETPTTPKQPRIPVIKPIDSNE